MDGQGSRDLETPLVAVWQASGDLVRLILETDDLQKRYCALY
jgi:hypothetical protein